MALPVAHTAITTAPSVLAIIVAFPGQADETLSGRRWDSHRDGVTQRTRQHFVCPSNGAPRKVHCSRDLDIRSKPTGRNAPAMRSANLLRVTGMIAITKLTAPLATEVRRLAREVSRRHGANVIA